MAPRIPTGRTVEAYGRAYFLDEVWDYHRGDHVTIIVPYGGGKTRLGLELLERSMTPKLPALLFVMKSEDIEVSRFAARNKLPIVRDWPPPPRSRLTTAFGKKPSGYVLWPVETDNPDADDIRHARIFRYALRRQYRVGSNITVTDETYSLEEEYKLTRDINRILTKGRSKGAGNWNFTQRAAYITKWAYQAQHLFLGFDPSPEAQQRLADIGGGIDVDLVREILPTLGKFEFLYLNRDERTMCRILAQ